MGQTINLDSVVAGCADDSFDDGIRIDSKLEPLAGAGGLVKPAVYEGGVYQTDRRWAAPRDEGPTPVIVIDNVPSQANRLEEALRRSRESVRRARDGPGPLRPAASAGAPASADLQPAVPASQCRRLPSRRPTRRAGLREDRTGAGHLRSHRSDVRSPWWPGFRRHFCTASGSHTWGRSVTTPNMPALGYRRSSGGARRRTRPGSSGSRVIPST